MRMDFYKVPKVDEDEKGLRSNNTVFHSVLEHFSKSPVLSVRPHVITSSIEHDSVLLVLRKMSNTGKIDLSEVCPDPSTGSVSVESVSKAIRDNTVLISIMLANNETGIIQPVGEIKKLIDKLDRKTILLHTDAAQAIGKIPVDVAQLGVDYLTIVGHKFYGPRIGALFVRGLEKGDTPLYPMFQGGGQERGYRPGTENTAMIVGLGQASKLVADNISDYSIKMAETRNYLERRLKDRFGELVVYNSQFPDKTERLPNTCNLSLKGSKFQGNRVLSLLKRCQASVGAACHSNQTNRPSPILVACGIPADVAINALRISVGRETTVADIDVFMEDLSKAVETLTDK